MTQKDKWAVAHMELQHFKNNSEYNKPSEITKAIIVQKNDEIADLKQKNRLLKKQLKEYEDMSAEDFGEMIAGM